MKITFTPGLGIKVIHRDNGVIVNTAGDKGQATQEVNYCKKVGDLLKW